MRLEAIEAQTLGRLLDELSVVVRESDAADPVVTRLFPSAYPDDADAEADYRDITESGLRSDRLERIAACGGELATTDPGSVAEIDLGDDEVAQRWLRTLNDLRLAIGTRIGVSEDEPEPDPGDPQRQERFVYLWLTQLQDSVVVGLLD